jgi:hypothetical protein
MSDNPIIIAFRRHLRPGMSVPGRAAVWLELLLKGREKRQAWGLGTNAQKIVQHKHAEKVMRKLAALDNNTASH